MGCAFIKGVNGGDSLLASCFVHPTGSHEALLAQGSQPMSS